MFTKGEWKAGKSKDTGLWHIHGGVSGGEYVCCLPTTGRSEANAQLIASAPDLYEALKLIYSKCRRLSTEEIIIVGKALAKAEGR